MNRRVRPRYWCMSKHQTHASVPLLRHLIEQSRTLTMDRADEVLDIMVSLYRYSVIDGPWSRLEAGNIPDSLLRAPYGAHHSLEGCDGRVAGMGLGQHQQMYHPRESGST